MPGFTRLSLLLTLLLLPSLAIAAPFTQSWQVHDLLGADGETVELRNDKNQLLKRVSMQQILRLYAVAQAIEKVAEVRTMMIIVDGEHPNAFATKIRAEMLSEEEIAKKMEQRQTRSKVVVGTKMESSGKIDEDKAVDVNLIGINFAMLDMLGMDMHMAAALIGHELGHIVLKHGEESKQKRPTTSTGFQSAAATKYSRENEREADYIGAIWMVEAGFDPQGAVRLQEQMYKTYKYKRGGFVGSHPSSTERIAKLKSLARRLSTTPR